MRPGLAGLLLLLAPLTGCAVKSMVHIRQADAAVDRAEERGAAEHAAYELTLAQEYLGKAREEAAEANHGTATELADQAAAYADQAAIKTQERTQVTEAEGGEADQDADQNAAGAEEPDAAEPEAAEPEAEPEAAEPAPAEAPAPPPADPAPSSGGSSPWNNLGGDP